MAPCNTKSAPHGTGSNAPCGGESDILRKRRHHGAKRIDRSNEREKAEAEKRKRLAEALRANLKRRKSSRTGGAPEASAHEPPPTGKE